MKRGFSSPCEQNKVRRIEHILPRDIWKFILQYIWNETNHLTLSLICKHFYFILHDKYFYQTINKPAYIPSHRLIQFFDDKTLYLKTATMLQNKNLLFIKNEQYPIWKIWAISVFFNVKIPDIMNNINKMSYPNLCWYLLSNSCYRPFIPYLKLDDFMYCPEKYKSKVIENVSSINFDKHHNLSPLYPTLWSDKEKRSKIIFACLSIAESKIDYWAETIFKLKLPGTDYQFPINFSESFARYFIQVLEEKKIYLTGLEKIMDKYPNLDYSKVCKNFQSDRLRTSIPTIVKLKYATSIEDFDQFDFCSEEMVKNILGLPFVNLNDKYCLWYILDCLYKKQKIKILDEMMSKINKLTIPISNTKTFLYFYK